MKCASDSVLGVAASNQHSSGNILPRFLIPETRTNRTQSTSELQQLILDKAYDRHEAAQARNRALVEAMDAAYAQRTKAIEIRHLKDRATVALQHRDMHDHLLQQTLEKQQRATFDQQQRAAVVTEAVTILPQARVRTRAQETAHKATLRKQLDAEIHKKRERHNHAQHVQRDEEVYFMQCVQKQHEKERQAMAQQKQADKEALMREWSRQKKKT
ncbi:hypothetical protein DYB32_004543 [Aphanomyces invadans]|nr:hypothetical protein DYB32_004543 [Aphanomyces invadans]